MRTHANAPDPIAAASAIVLSYAGATLPDADPQRGNAAPVIAMTIGIAIAALAISTMLAGTAVTPFWCAFTTVCR